MRFAAVPLLALLTAATGCGGSHADPDPNPSGVPTTPTPTTPGQGARREYR